MALDYSSLLSGSTGALGFGGGVGTEDGGPVGTSSSTGAPISTSMGDLRGGSANQQNLQVSFPAHPGRGYQDTINPPETEQAPKFGLWIGLAVVGIIALAIIFRS